jgi:hypothetical protein
MTDEAIKADAIEGMNNVALNQFIAKMAPTGHIYKVNDIVTTITSFVKGGGFFPPLPFVIDFKGTCLIDFECDVSDPWAHNSPQLIEVLSAVLIAIAMAIVAHPLAFLLIIAIVAFAIGATLLINTGTGAIVEIGKNAGSIVALGIVAIAGVALLVFLPTLIGSFRGKKPTRRRK